MTTDSNKFLLVWKETRQILFSNSHITQAQKWKMMPIFSQNTSPLSIYMTLLRKFRSISALLNLSYWLLVGQPIFLPKNLKFW